MAAGFAQWGNDLYTGRRSYDIVGRRKIWFTISTILVILSAICGVGSMVLLLSQAHRGARLLAIGAVATVIAGWGVAQWPYVLPETLKVEQAAAPSGTLTAVLVVFAVAVVTILPSIGLLYVLDQKSLLPEEGVHDEPGTSGQSSPV